MKKLLMVPLSFLLFGIPAAAQTTDSGQQPSDAIKLISISTAIKATTEIRSQVYDPTSFSLLSVVSITMLQKDGSTFFGGCVHYVASNLYGGRLQAWGGYYTKKGALHSFPGTTTSSCDKPNKNAAVIDITDEVKRDLPAL